MDIGESSLPASINHNNFPAKLWRLVNNPANKAICWDSFGEVIIIDQHLFERQILSPSTTTLDNADAFKTTNFSSFVRQLNLYGFRKADPAVKDNPTGDSGAYHHFHNPNFKRNHPELVASLRRLTVDNKAKLQAGLNVNCRPPSRYQRFSGDDDGRDKNVKRVCQCYHPNLVASHMTGSGLQTGLFSPHSYYQASYPVNMVCRGDHNQDLESKENQEVKKCDINLDTIFQIADEVMQTPANSYLVRVATPEKPSPVLVPSSNTCNTMFCDNPASTTKANPLCVGPIIMAVSGNPNLVTYEQQEESVVFVPEQMPEDAIFEVTSDDAKDTEVIGVEVSDTLRDTSQAYNSSCTGSKPDH
ncbi:heat shock factor protein 5 isoform X2 [Siniperca chuatsi]|uniref:heat shock factor protein 5 isoform X2 n=1 Tax=Siniperca chuatsi TaxID=119488 RepID=UPI001CE05DBA|nr:heat shock factor protein 5 isoform X2 [Siniperca chuatsi]